MPGRMFVDTSAFLALEDETLTLIRSRLGIPASIDFSRKIRSSSIVRVISVSSEVEEKALDLFERYDDKDFSLTDCVSFVVMKDLGIRDAFTFDEHFVQAGFSRVP
jgi:uncharacterized protein